VKKTDPSETEVFVPEEYEVIPPEKYKKRQSAINFDGINLLN